MLGKYRGMYIYIQTFPFTERGQNRGRDMPDVFSVSHWPRLSKHKSIHAQT